MKVRAWEHYYPCPSCNGTGIVCSPSIGETDGPKDCYRCSNGIIVTVVGARKMNEELKYRKP